MSHELYHSSTGLAADLCKISMVKLCSRISSESDLHMKLLLQIHDELLFEVADRDVDRAVELVSDSLETDRLLEGYVEFRLPLEVKVLVGKRWGKMEEMEKE